MTNLIAASIFLSSFFSCASQKNSSLAQPRKDSIKVVVNNSSVKSVPVLILPHNEAFFTVTAAGTQMVNENGQAVTNFTIDRFVILELEGKAIPKIISVKYNDRKYNVESISSQDDVIVTKKLTDGKSHLIKSNDKNVFLKLKVSPADGNEDSKTALHNIEVKGSINAKPFIIKIPGETELQGEMRY